MSRACCLAMLIAVDFNDNTAAHAGKVRHKTANWYLPADMKSVRTQLP
jgi:hypothetical protein